MRLCRSRPFVIALFALLVPLGMDSTARADLVLGFPNGLTGWSTPNDGSAFGDPGTVTSSGGLTTIGESAFASETDIFITFVVPTGASSLQFTLNSVFADSTVANNQANNFPPDAFGASLIDPITGGSLVPTATGDKTTDSYYIRDIVDTGGGAIPAGVFNTQIVAESPSDGTLPVVVSLDLSSAGLDGQTAEVLFRLSGGDDQSTSSVTISNVIVIAGGAVPEPASIVLACTALVIVAGFVGARSRRKMPGTPQLLPSRPTIQDRHHIHDIACRGFGSL